MRISHKSRSLLVAAICLTSVLVFAYASGESREDRQNGERVKDRSWKERAKLPIELLRKLWIAERANQLPGHGNADNFAWQLQQNRLERVGDYALTEEERDVKWEVGI